MPASCNEAAPVENKLRPAADGRVAPPAASLVGVHGFDLTRNAVKELQVFVSECIRCDVAQVGDTLRCVSESAKHSGVDFPAVAVLKKALLDGADLPILSVVKLLVKSLGSLDIFEVHLLFTLVGRSPWILSLIVFEVAEIIFSPFSRKV